MLGCGTPEPAVAQPSRVDAVLAEPARAVPVAEFCEVHPSEAQAPTFAWPALDGPAPALGSRWTWVNVWATWCAPCIAEMPMLARWQEKLAAEGVAVDLRYLSVDATAAELEAGRRANPSRPDSVRIANTSTLEPWLVSIGLDSGAVLPIHLFVDPRQRVRCARLGALSEDDYDVVRAVLAGG